MSHQKEVICDDDESEGDDCPVGPELMDRSDESDDDDDKSDGGDDPDSQQQSNEENNENRTTPYLVYTGRRKEQAMLVLSPSLVLRYFDAHGFNPDAEPDSSDEDDNEKEGRSKPLAALFDLKFKMPKADTIVAAILKIHGFKRVLDAKPLDTWQRHTNGNWYRPNDRSGPTDSWNIHWSGSHLKPQFARQLKDYQRVNHFPRSFELTRKDRLFKNIQRMQLMKGLKYFDFVPQSFVMPHDFSELCSAFLKDRSALFIVKPVALSRGRGVFLINSPEQVPLDESHIVSRYVSNPLLVDGFKFDLRIYVAVTSFDPLVIYMYEEGLTRFATVKYTTSTRHIRQNCMHLTNYAVNKQNRAFVQNMDADIEDFGNKWSLGALLRYLRKQGINPVVLMMRIEDVIIKTIIAAEQHIASACRMSVPHSRNCFELFGFDILVDENLQPWLVEVNLSPSLACDSPLDIKVKTHMLSDLFSLVGIPCGKPGDKTVPATNATKNRNQSEPDATSHAHRLTTDEAKFVRHAKEEYLRRGGWLRVFPSSYSMQLYGPLFVDVSLRNRALHQNLFPESAAPARGSNGEQRMFRGVSLHNLTLNNVGYSTGSHGNHAQVSASESLLFTVYTEVAARCAYYERKLNEPPVVLNDVAQLIPPPKNDSASRVNSATSSTSSGTRKQETLNKMELRSRVEPAEKAIDATPILTAAAISSSEVKYDFELKHILSRLTLVQARSLLVRFLVWLRSQLGKQSIQRETGRASPPVRRTAISTDCTLFSDEQAEAISSFLKKAGRNLSTPVAIETPSRSLTHDQRCVMTGKLIDEFLSSYKRETEALKHRLQSLTLAKNADVRDDDNEVPERSLKMFIRHSSISQLTSVLLDFAKRHSNTAVLLGVSPYSLGSLLDVLFGEQNGKAAAATTTATGRGRVRSGRLAPVKQTESGSADEDEADLDIVSVHGSEASQSQQPVSRDRAHSNSSSSANSQAKWLYSVSSRHGARNPAFGASLHSSSNFGGSTQTTADSGVKCESDKHEANVLTQPLKVSNVNEPGGYSTTTSGNANTNGDRQVGARNRTSNSNTAEWLDASRTNSHYTSQHKTFANENNANASNNHQNNNAANSSPSAIATKGINTQSQASSSTFGVRPGYTSFAVAPTSRTLRSMSPDTLSLSSVNSQSIIYPQQQQQKPDGLYVPRSTTMSSLRSAAEVYTQKPVSSRPPGHYMIVQSQKTVPATRLRRRSNSRNGLRNAEDTASNGFHGNGSGNELGTENNTNRSVASATVTRSSKAQPEAAEKTAIGNGAGNHGMPPPAPAPTHPRLVARRPRAPGTLLTNPHPDDEDSANANGNYGYGYNKGVENDSSLLLNSNLSLAIAVANLSSSRPGSAASVYAERALQKLNERSQSRLYNSSNSPLF